LDAKDSHRKEQLRSLIPNGKLHELISNIRSVLHIKQLLLCTTPGHRSHKNKTHDLAEKLYPKNASHTPYSTCEVFFFIARGPAKRGLCLFEAAMIVVTLHSRVLECQQAGPGVKPPLLFQTLQSGYCLLVSNK
jgi:hypothetical protein